MVDRFSLHRRFSARGPFIPKRLTGRGGFHRDQNVLFNPNPIGFYFALLFGLIPGLFSTGWKFSVVLGAFSICFPNRVAGLVCKTCAYGVLPSSLKLAVLFGSPLMGFTPPQAFLSFF